MKRFQMITEADARVLEYGSAVVLAAGGHVTPLALDTLRARRIEVVREGADADAAAMAPPADIRRVALAGDHTAVALKNGIRQHLRGRGLAVDDLGTDSSEPVDYPDTAAAVALTVSRGEADAEALAIVDTFFATPMREARYIRRLAKIRELESRPRS
jgi:hypothetical protein